MSRSRSAAIALTVGLLLGGCAGEGTDDRSRAEPSATRTRTASIAAPSDVPTTNAPTTDPPLADEPSIRRYMQDNFIDASWYRYIKDYEVTRLWVQVETNLFPDPDAREPGLRICGSVMQAPHGGEGFLPVRVVGSNGEKIADNLGSGGNTKPCEASI